MREALGIRKRVAVSTERRSRLRDLAKASASSRSVTARRFRAPGLAAKGPPRVWMATDGSGFLPLMGGQPLAPLFFACINSG
jgi:hypothetical protein